MLRIVLQSPLRVVDDLTLHAPLWTMAASLLTAWLCRETEHLKNRMKQRSIPIYSALYQRCDTNWVAKEDPYLSLPPNVPFGLRTNVWTAYTCVSEATLLVLFTCLHVLWSASDEKLVWGFPFLTTAYIGLYDEHPRSDTCLPALYMSTFYLDDKD